MNKKIKDILCCPDCKEDLEDKKTYLYCKTCNREYKIKDGIIVLIPKELEEELRK
jgi:uncharacterized protein YbaR (Trm112 family)